MKQESLEYRGLARRLLENEAGPAERPAGTAAAERVCAKLSDGLSRLVGPAGFRALMQRALYLARAEHPLLRNVREYDGNCLKGLAESAAGQDPIEVDAALVSVFGGFFWLLSTFIGEDLARRQIRRIWPGIPLEEADASAEEAWR